MDEFLKIDLDMVLWTQSCLQFKRFLNADGRIFSKFWTECYNIWLNEMKMYNAPQQYVTLVGLWYKQGKLSKLYLPFI